MKRRTEFSVKYFFGPAVDGEMIVEDPFQLFHYIKHNKTEGGDVVTAKLLLEKGWRIFTSYPLADFINCQGSLRQNLKTWTDQVDLSRGRLRVACTWGLPMAACTPPSCGSPPKEKR